MLTVEPVVGFGTPMQRRCLVSGCIRLDSRYSIHILFRDRESSTDMDRRIGANGLRQADPPH